MDEPSILDKVLSSKQVADIQNFHPRDTLALLMKELTSKEEETLRSRFGLGAHRVQTLEEIGKRFAVTRERVRQIEEGAIQKLKHLKQFRTIIHDTDELIRQLLETHGGAMTEEGLLRELFRDHTPTEEDRQAVLFFLQELLNDHLDPLGRAQGFRSGWKLKAVPATFLQQTIEQIIAVFRLRQEAMTLDSLLRVLGTESYFQQHAEKLTEEVVLAAMELSPKIGHNPFQEYGLVAWGTIAPKRMNDKIYLLLKKRGSPMHFTEIAKAINETHFDSRTAYPPTVHNELILNKRYVLVGRGIYALREWGYKPGVVADVLADILRTAEGPMTRDALVGKVLEQRFVKKNTIHLALANPMRFEHLPDGRYRLAAGSTPPNAAQSEPPAPTQDAPSSTPQTPAASVS